MENFNIDMKVFNFLCDNLHSQNEATKKLIGYGNLLSLTAFNAMQDKEHASKLSNDIEKLVNNLINRILENDTIIKYLSCELMKQQGKKVTNFTDISFIDEARKLN